MLLSHICTRTCLNGTLTKYFFSTNGELSYTLNKNAWAYSETRTDLWVSPTVWSTGLRRAVGNVSGNRCESDCRYRGREFDPSPLPYLRGDWSWNNFYGHSPPFRWIIIEGFLSVTGESMFTKYWLTACSSLPRKKCS